MAVRIEASTLTRPEAWRNVTSEARYLKNNTWVSAVFVSSSKAIKEMVEPPSELGSTVDT